MIGTRLSYALLCVLLCAGIAAGQNQIPNWEFDEPDSDLLAGPFTEVWYLWQGENFEGISIVEGAGLSGPYAMRVDIGTGSVDPLQVFQSNCVLQQGVTYTIAFMAKADAPRTISLGLQTRTNSPQQWHVYWRQDNLELTTEPQLFMFEYTHTDPDDGGTAAFNDGVDLHFWLAGDGTDLYLDYIWMGEGTPPPPVGEIVVATKPAPADGATDVPRDVVLSWQPGDLAETHQVYFGTDFDDVNTATGAASQSADSYSLPDLLDFETTYYWRVDEVNAAPDFTVFPGPVWSFTSEPFAYPLTNIVASSNATSDSTGVPQNTVNGSGLNANDEHSIAAGDMWLALPSSEPVYIEYEFDQVYLLHEMLIWNYNVQFERVLGFGVKNATLEYSQDGTEWTVLGDVELGQGTSTAAYTANTTVSLDGVSARYVRLTVNEGFGMLGQYGLSEVRFMYIPTQPREPQPADGATDVAVDTDLSWRAGRDATSHEVYFGTDPDAVGLAGTADTAGYDPGALDLATTYYWQVTELQETESWPGALWSFATQDYLVVDDFESYNDKDNLIYESWIDGWVNGTGSTVGYLEAPFAERSIVHSGNQAMPLFYDNTGVAESEADFELAQDWSAHGIQTLSLYFYGDPPSTGGQLYVKINGTKIPYEGAPADPSTPAWQSWDIDLSAAGDVSNVRSLTIGVEGAGANGVVYIDDIRLLP